MKNIKTKLAWILMVSLLLINIMPLTAWADTDTNWKDVLESTDNYIEEHKSSEDWSTFAMARKIRADLTESKFIDYAENIENTDFSNKDSSAYTSALLALEAIGRGSSEKSEELTKKLMYYDASDNFFITSSVFTKANMLQCLQGQVDLNTSAYQKNKTKIDETIEVLKTELSNNKETDGAYWKSWGNKDIDTTAAVSDALFRYDDTKQLASDAANWIFEEKASDEGYGYSYNWSTFEINGRKSNVNSTAMALIALAENKKSDKAESAVNAMMIHYLGNGSFEYDSDTYGTMVPNDMATEQADYALVAYERSVTAGAASLFDFSDVKAVYYFSFDGNGASNSMHTQAIEEGDTGNLNANTLIRNGYRFLCWKDAEGNTYTNKQAVTASKDIALYAVWERIVTNSRDKDDDKYVDQDSYYDEVMRVKSPNAVTGDWKLNDSGKWTFFIDGLQVKGRWVTAINPAAGKNKAGWFYFDEKGEMLTGWQKIKDADGIERWYYLNPHPDPWYGACFRNTITPDGYVVDENGVWLDPNIVAQEEISKITEKVMSEETASDSSNGTESGEESKKEKKIYVSVSVSGNTIFGSEEVMLNKNASAYDALRALAKSSGWTVSGSGSYVKGIGGEMEKSAGALSGWSYSVNGDTPNKSAGSYKLKDGDSVDWTFVDGPDY